MNGTKKIKETNTRNPVAYQMHPKQKVMRLVFSPMLFDEYILLCIDKTCKALKINTD